MNQSPPSSPAHCFARRRAELARKFVESGGSPSFVIAAGWARVRNFAHNLYPFRAESHFLYLVGEHLEGAVLCFSEGSFSLFLVEPEPDEALWHGPTPSLSEWEERLGLPVHPITEFAAPPHCATLPPQDEETSLWLTQMLSRDIEAQSGPLLEGGDAILARSIVSLRLVQDEFALEQMRFAGKVSAAAHREGMRVTKEARREAMIRGAMEGTLISAGLSPAYTSIVTVCGEILHASESKGEVSADDLVLADVGGETREGFAADITRTWPASGKFSSTQSDVYQLVLFVQKEAISRVRAGVSYKDLHSAAVRRMGEGLVQLGILKGSLDELYDLGAISLFFPHGLGHLLGLDVHDMEDLGDLAGYGDEPTRSQHPAESTLRMTRTLVENMVVTIEPGFYQVPLLLERARAHQRVSGLVDWNRLKQFSDVRGIRIEDDVRVTPSDPEVLSAEAPKELKELEAVRA